MFIGYIPGLKYPWIIRPEFNVSSRRVVRNYAEAIYESNYIAAMIERRPTRRRSLPRDNRWRRTLPEANILIRKLLGLSTSKFLDTDSGLWILAPPSNSGLRSFVIAI